MLVTKKTKEKMRTITVQPQLERVENIPPKDLPNKGNYLLYKMEHDILVTPEEAIHFTEHYSYIQKLKNTLERDANEPSEERRGKYVRLKLRNCMRLMKFVSPNNDIGDSTWACMANCNRIDQLFVILRTKMNMKGRAVANYIRHTSSSTQPKQMLTPS